MSNLKLSLAKDGDFGTCEQSHKRCPNCDSKGLSLFYRTDGIPVHSCLLTSSREEALNFPKGNLWLGFCHQCGFITNTCFNPETQNYSGQYETTQGFSACFNTFAESLAQKLIDKYDIHKKIVLEIGCGKGEFITLMCKLGNNRGIGIDPAYVPEPNLNEDTAQIDFIQDFYSEKYAHLKADIICCRHTLEHIAETLEFIQKLRRNIAERPETFVFFEVPDVTRILGNGAFWDIYYEHCSYFTADSLARLFQLSGFEIENLFYGYDGQYLMITAYPTNISASIKSAVENNLDQLVLEFGEKSLNRINYWQNTIQQMIENSQKVALWGSSSNGVSFLNTLKLKDKIKYVVDINPYKHGKYIPGAGQKIVSPQFLTKYKPNKIILMNPIYRDEIQQELHRLNVKADLLAV